MNEERIARALRLLESQKRASHGYYERNKNVIKAKSLEYWKEHREAINLRRRELYAMTHPKPRATQETPGDTPVELK